VDLEFVDIKRDNCQNLAIIDADVRASEGVRQTVVVTLQNFSQSAQQAELQFSDGVQTKVKRVRLPGLQRIKVTMVVEHSESSEGVLRLLSDSIDFDDEFRLWMGELPPVEILVVSPLKENRNEELFFLKKVLSIRQKKSPRGFQVTPIADDLFGLVDLSKVAGIVFTGSLAYFDQSALDKVKLYLESGGTVLVTPGGAAALQYQKLLQSGLFNSKFNGINRSVNRRRFFVNMVNKSTLLSSVFPPMKEGDLFQFIIWKYCRIQSFSPVQDILLSADNEPLLSVQAHQKGRLYVLGFALDSVWSEMPISSSFLPMVQAIFSVGDDSGVSRMTVDEWYKVFTGVGNPLSPTATLFENRPVEVNVDRAESDSHQVTFSELRYAFKGRLDERAVDKSLVSDGAGENVFTESYQEELLLVVLFLFLLELFGSLFGDMWSFRKLEEG
jgi:hypothetical protein